MSANVFFDAERQVVVAQLHGQMRSADIVGFVEEMIAVTQQTQCHKWIVDYTDAVFTLSTVEIYELPTEVLKRMEKLGNDKRLIRRAIISAAGAEDLLFLENVAVNQGQNLRIFNNEDDALKWLFPP